jgi:hypothetical protein
VRANHRIQVGVPHAVRLDVPIEEVRDPSERASLARRGYVEELPVLSREPLKPALIRSQRFAF